MVSLNLERINSNSPYAVTALRDSMCFRFVTDFGVIYYASRDADGIQNYAAIIIRLDNPNLKSIVAEFTETIQMLSQKPE